jgi:nitroreductase
VTAAVLLDLLRGRRSIRRFRNEAIDRAVVRQLVDAARWAPSAGNRQDWELVVVTSAEVKGQMAQAVAEAWDAALHETGSEAVRDSVGSYAHNFDWFLAAPLVLAAACADPAAFLTDLVGPRAAAVSGARFSAAMAVENLLLMAHALGLGSCCLTGPLAAEERLKALLGMGRRRELVCLVALGIPDEAPAPPDRRSIDDMVRFVE